MGPGNGSDGFDVVIVGGGPAGLSAALVLGRMRRRTLVCDTGAPANAVSHGVGGLLTRDGVPPSELRAIGREQVAAYPSVEFREQEVTAARTTDDGFALDLGEETVATRKLLLAHGLAYGRPELDGLEPLWGELAFHCPYCHGWEVRDRRVVVVATNPRAGHQALLLGSIADQVTVVGDVEIAAEDRRLMERAGVELLDAHVERVARDGGRLRLELAGQEPIECDAIFIQPELSLTSDLAERLGVELPDEGTIPAEKGGATSVPGLHVAGDALGPPQAVSIAIGSGADSAFAINLALAYEDAGADAS